MTLRIAIITDAWHPQINGVVTTLDNTRMALEQAGHRIKRITPEQFSTVPCPTYPSIRLALAPYRKLSKLLDEFKPERIHIATEGPLGLAGRRYCLNRKLAFTTSFHTLFAEYLNLRLKIPLAWSYGLLRRFHAPAKRVMVATPSVESILKSRGFKNPMVRWSRGVDHDLFQPMDKSQVPLPRPVLIYVGRVAIEKNIDAFLSLNLPGTKMVVGDGPQLKSLKARYPDVVFAGFQTGETLANLIAGADVFVFPSRTDTFGIVMLEALACGVPVAAYPIMGPLDVISNDKIGRLDENLQKAVIEALSLNPNDCRDYALKFTWSHCARQFLQNLVPVCEDADARLPESNGVAERAIG